MSSSDSICFRLVLRKCEPAAEAGVAAALMNIFNISENLARKIMSAAPVAVLSELNMSQAAGIFQAFDPVVKAGGAIEIDAGLDSNVRQVGWPTTPKILGKPLIAYCQKSVPGVEINCPACGATLTMSITAKHGKTTVNQPKKTDTAMSPVPVEAPAPAPLPGRKTETAAAASPLAAPATSAAEPVSNESLLDDLDDDPLFSLDDMGSFVETAAVPIIGNEDLNQFETGQQPPITGNDIFNDPKPVPPSQRTTAPASVQATPSGSSSNLPQSGTGSFCVVVLQTTKPIAAKLVADYMKISMDEAAELLHKPMVTVVKGVSKEHAAQVIQKFTDAGVKSKLAQIKR
ncbi:MAG: hypothetical protein JXR97_13670 [Planctomycetes bacterium]|nr:hypothetical protein [Planctomycetota bacterium]